jgi:hypothetical protein
MLFQALNVLRLVIVFGNASVNESSDVADCGHGASEGHHHRPQDDEHGHQAPEWNLARRNFDHSLATFTEAGVFQVFVKQTRAAMRTVHKKSLLPRPVQTITAKTNRAALGKGNVV